MIDRRTLIVGGLAAVAGVPRAGAGALDGRPAAGSESLDELLLLASPDLRLPAGRTFVTGRRVHLPPDGVLDLQGSVIVVDRDDSSDTTAVEVVRIRNGSVIVPEGRVVERLLGDTRPARAPGLWENLRVVQEIGSAPQPRNLDDNDDAAVRIRTSGTLVRDLTIENFDYALRIYADDVTAEAVSIVRAVKGLILDGCSGFRGRTIVSRGRSPNASTEPGHNAIGSGAAGSGPLFDTEITGFDLFETGEHGIYFARSTDSRGRGLTLSDGVVRRAGQCGIKLRYYERVVVARVLVEDCSWGNRTGSNEDGLRFERCSDLSIIGAVVRSTGRADSAHYGLVLQGTRDVRLDGLAIARTAAGGIQVATSRIEGKPDETVSGIVGRDISIRDCGGPAIVIDHADAEIGPIEFSGLLIDGCPGAPVDIRIGPVAEGARIVLRGTYRNCGAGLETLPSHPRIDLSGLVPG